MGVLVTAAEERAAQERTRLQRTAAEQRHALAMEDGLAEAISLASAALRAGASPLESLERASAALPARLRPARRFPRLVCARPTAPRSDCNKRRPVRAAFLL